MGGYLIDTNIWAYWFDAERYPLQHVNILKHIDGLPTDARIIISAITWGEIAVGLPGTIQKNHLKFIQSKKPLLISLDTNMAEEYGKLRGLISEDRKKKRIFPDKSIDQFTWLEFGSLENDLWIAAQAIVLKLTLVTNDKLNEIKEVASDELHIENWAIESCGTG